MTQVLRMTLTTGSAQFAIWDGKYFQNVVDYDSWESELLDDVDIERHIALGHYVPITIYSDGAFEFEVRIEEADNAAGLVEREREYQIAESKPYLFRSSGELNVSGIEFVEAQPESEVGSLKIAKGDYFVTVHHIDWKRAPGAIDSSGNPAKDALPDFIVLAQAVGTKSIEYRRSSQTFGD